MIVDGMELPLSACVSIRITETTEAARGTDSTVKVTLEELEGIR